jgi:hypothetical protein
MVVASSRGCLARQAVVGRPSFTMLGLRDIAAMSVGFAEERKARPMGERSGHEL